MLKIHNRLNNKKYDSDEDSSPKKQDQEDEFILGSENDGDEYSDDSDKSPLAVNKYKNLRHATTVLPQQTLPA